MNRIGIVIADDQALFIEGLKAVLRSYAKDIEILAAVGNGEEAVAAVGEYGPEVVLLDVRMPVMDGVEAAKIIHELYSSTKIMMLTTFDDDEYVQNAIQNGAAAYILKDIPPQEFIEAIRAINGGTVLISPRVAQKLVSHLDGGNGAVSPEPMEVPEWMDALSRREQEILRYIADGYGNPEIAVALCIAEQTVRNHVSVIYSKLGVHSRFDAMKKARTVPRELG